MPQAAHVIALAFRLLPMIHMAITGLIFSAWSIGLLLVWHYRPHYPRLSSVKFDHRQVNASPKLSVVVPACNEASTIERAMRSLLALDYPDLEIIAVDDRSTDETGDILDCLAAGNPRLRVLHIDKLPKGWLGKNHALHFASEFASGEWILFTDADVVYRPDTLRMAVGYACKTGADHLVACPRCRGFNFWERLFMSYFGLMFLFRVRPWAVGRLRRAAYFGFGAFNLVKAETYRRCGGHSALPMEVADDTKLGKILKQDGARTAIVDASDYISLRWVIGLRGIMNGFTKNAFASFDFSLTRTALGLCGLILSTLYPIAAICAPVGPARWLGVGTLLAMVGGAFTMRRLTDADARYGLAYPIAGLMVITIILRSTFVTLRQRGIVWRGTYYPLDELKRGIV
jgi:cellulose synthase/poly-beta-1,6-N-acetylglucosamine synthase-like glycosyltransferase